MAPKGDHILLLGPKGATEWFIILNREKPTWQLRQAGAPWGQAIAYGFDVASLNFDSGKPFKQNTEREARSWRCAAGIGVGLKESKKETSHFRLPL